jgi:predicted house-cleaning NTP pyrophosphatase (Maf/HAM1 superfamily)
MESLTGPDPTALIGLPMIALTRLLRDLGIDPLVDS